MVRRPLSCLRHWAVFPLSDRFECQRLTEAPHSDALRSVSTSTLSEASEMVDLSSTHRSATTTVGWLVGLVTLTEALPLDSHRSVGNDWLALTEAPVSWLSNAHRSATHFDALRSVSNHTRLVKWRSQKRHPPLSEASVNHTLWVMYQLTNSQLVSSLRLPIVLSLSERSVSKQSKQVNFHQRHFLLVSNLSFLFHYQRHFVSFRPSCLHFVFLFRFTPTSHCQPGTTTNTFRW